MFPDRDLIMYIADAMLGRLAKWMRVLGLDTVYEYDIGDEELVERARAEGRLILTRDTALARRVGPEGCLFIRDDDPVVQLKQVIDELELRLTRDGLFTRCLVCNAQVVPATPEDVAGEVPEYVLATVLEFKRCTGCGRVYWPGTHIDRILKRLAPAMRGAV